MKKIFILLFALSSALISNAQQPHRCSADHMHQHLRNTDPEFIQRAEDYNRQIQELIAANRENRVDGEVIIIPVVFHILHNWGVENISDEQIYDQMRILNEDYRLLNADTSNVIDFFRPIMADSKIEFRLAQKDFEGNCTNGIDRIATTETYVGDDGSKVNPWPRDRYLNIWVVNSIANGAAGYAYYPSAVPSGIGALRDGIIIIHSYIGSIGTGSIQRSSALTHEVGHWINLSHVWGDTNEPTVSCGDDNVEDTPPTAGWDACSVSNDPFNCNSLQLTADYQYTFNDVTFASGATDPTPIPSTVENRITFSSAKAVGVSENSSAQGRLAYTNWELSSTLNNQKYYEFEISSDLGTSMSLTEIRFNFRRNGVGPLKFAIRGSHDNFSSNLPVSVASNPFVSANAVQNIFIAQDEAMVSDVVGLRVTLSNQAYTTVRNGSLKFRIYGWEAQSEFGSLEIDNLTFSGTYGQVENLQNYMEYTYCSYMFTEGQAERMRAALQLPLAGRNNLYSQQNLEFTGVVDNGVNGCAPEADFYADRIMTCVGQPVTFFDYTRNSTPTDFYWDIPEYGITIEENPTVIFTTPGWKTVTYRSSNAFGLSIITKQAVYVSGTPNYQSGLVQESFSNQQIFNDNYIVRNLDSNSSYFQWTNAAGYSDLGCAYLNAFDMDETLIDTGNQDRDQLYFPAFDLSTINGSGPSETLTFKYAYATAAASISDITDYFILESSEDCGQTWSARNPLGAAPGSQRITGTTLVSGGSYTTPFTPSNTNEWKSITYVIPNNLLIENAMFRITFVTGSYPNNFYVDDIQIDAILSVDDINADQNSFKLYPNPTSTSTQVEFTLTESQDVTISLTDLSGRLVYNQLYASRNTGVNNIELPIENLTDGMYVVTIRTNNTSVSQRLVVRK